MHFLQRRIRSLKVQSVLWTPIGVTVNGSLGLCLDGSVRLLSTSWTSKGLGRTIQRVKWIRYGCFRFFTVHCECQLWSCQRDTARKTVVLEIRIIQRYSRIYFIIFCQQSKRNNFILQNKICYLPEQIKRIIWKTKSFQWILSNNFCDV